MFKDIMGIVWRILLAISFALIMIAYILLVTFLTFGVVFPLWLPFWVVAFAKRNRSKYDSDRYKKTCAMLYILMNI